MYRILVALLLFVVFTDGVSAEEATTSVTVSGTIVPIPLQVTVVDSGDTINLIVLFYDGGVSGWTIQIDCDCEVVPIGPVVTLKGIPANWQFGPFVTGKALRAEPGGGQGEYRQQFEKPTEDWTIRPILDDPGVAGESITVTFMTGNEYYSS